MPALVVQSPFRVLESTLGPGVAAYRDGYAARKAWRDQLNDSLSDYDDAIRVLKGTPEAIAARTKEILAQRDKAYQDLVVRHPPPVNPNDLPSVTDDDKRLYTLLEQAILEKAEADIPRMESIVRMFQPYCEGLRDGLIATIDSEVEKKKAADAAAIREQKRVSHDAKIWGTIGQTVGAVVGAIPLVVTQVIGAAISVGFAVAQTAVELDAARKLSHTIRDNANWLLYEQPGLVSALDEAEWNLDYITALLPLFSSMTRSSELRRQINSMKLEAGIYDEAVLAQSKKGVKILWKIAFYAGLAYAAWRLTFK